MKDRIKEIMEYKQLTSSQFADAVEVPRAVISHVLSGRNNPSLEVVTKIVSSFPEININWMLLGEGEMLTTLANKIVSKPTRSEVKAEEPPVIKNDSDKIDEHDKVQNKVTPKSDKLSGSDKEIEQIVIFYSDKTFIAYKP